MVFEGESFCCDPLFMLDDVASLRTSGRQAAEQSAVRAEQLAVCRAVSCVQSS